MSQPPMGDAAFASTQEPMAPSQGEMGANAPMGQDMMGAETTDQTTGGQPMDDGEMPMNGQDMPMDQPPMDGGEMGDVPANDDSTENIISQLSDPDDVEAVRNFALYYLDKEKNGGNQVGGEPPMMESVVFTKKQLKKIHENFQINNDDELKHRKNKEKGLQRKRTSNTSKNSPFNSPKFN